MSPSAADRPLHRQVLRQDRVDRRAVRRLRGDLCRLHAPAGDLGARLALDWLHGCSGSAGPSSRSTPLLRGRLGRRRRADDVHHRLARAPGRPRDHPPAEAGAGLRRRLQRLPDVHRPALRRLPRHGRAALRRRRDGGHDGLCRERRLGGHSARPAPRASSATPTTPPRTISARRAGSAPCRMR